MGHTNLLYIANDFDNGNYYADVLQISFYDTNNPDIQDVYAVSRMRLTLIDESRTSFSDTNIPSGLNNDLIRADRIEFELNGSTKTYTASVYVISTIKPFSVY